MSGKILLLGTSGCHLCEEAESLMEEAVRNLPAKFNWKTIDIAEHEHWQSEYGVRIPVLRHPDSGKELSWPFDLTTLLKFFEELNHL
ncbi:MAG: glutaredoxin family protein [Gammaproteobacteria bacterium]